MRLGGRKIWLASRYLPVSTQNTISKNGDKSHIFLPGLAVLTCKPQAPPVPSMGPENCLGSNHQYTNNKRRLKTTGIPFTVHILTAALRSAYDRPRHKEIPQPWFCRFPIQSLFCFGGSKEEMHSGASLLFTGRAFLSYVTHFSSIRRASEKIYLIP
jgi:hypothetical protein